MSALLVPYQLPLFVLPECRPGGGTDGVDCLDHITLQNREHGPPHPWSGEANDIQLCGLRCGAPTFRGREPFVTLADLSGLRFGAAASAPALEALGVTVVETSPAGMYEALAGDVVDVTRAGFSTTMDLKWYEPAEHYVWDGTYAAGNALTVNLRTWARLSPETQEIFYEAALDAETLSGELSAAEVRLSTGQA